MGHPVIVRIDQEAPHPPDLTVDGMDLVPGPYLVLTHRNNVFDERPPAFRNVPEILEPTANGRQCVTADVIDKAAAQDANVAYAFVGFVAELALFSGVELVELREGAVQPDLAVRGLGQATRNKPRGLLRVPPLDDKVGR